MHPDPEVPSANHLDSVLQGATVLVVDDMPQARRALSRIVQRVGAEVLEAADGPEALALLQGQTPDAVLLDIDMPGMSGLQVCQAIRQGEAPPRMPVLFVTGREDEDRHVAGFVVGCDDFLAKPVVPAVLVARVANLLAKRNAERENQRLVRALSRYVPLPARDGKRHHGVQSLVGTILFSDLRGFTAAALHIDPGELFRAVSQLQAAQTRLVHEAGGYVDKFTGDGMLAVFTSEDHAAQACTAATAIRAFGRDFGGPLPWLPLPIGLGLACGPFLRGDMGGDDYVEMTVIGPAVNLAARLCGQAGPLEVLAPTELRDAVLGVHPFDGPTPMQIKGITEPVPVWRLV